MKLELDVFGSLCTTAVFTINGVVADKCDFGDQCDNSPETAEDYGCGDMRFTRTGSTPDVLRKYGITEAEYSLIAGQLETLLSFGACGWCI